MTLKKAVRDILEYFDSDYEKLLIWFHYPNPGLGGIAPTTMIMNGRTDKLCLFIRNALAENVP